MAEPAPWIVCQIGAREHYVLAEGLHRRGLLAALVTDRWVPPWSLFAGVPGAVGKRLAERYNPELADARVIHFTSTSLAREAMSKARGLAKSWPKIMADNAWFQQCTVTALEHSGLLESHPRPVVFAYSYAALDVLRAARAAGCVTVLGQIDPAIAEEDIVAALPQTGSAFTRAPASYWAHWREECALADHIVVNSRWSHDGLVQAGVAPDKLHIVPLAYAAPPVPRARDLPSQFTAARPLRVLFLGSLIARKGITEVLAAAHLLEGTAVEFHLVGPGGEGLAAPANTVIHGPVSRHEAPAHFAGADLFVLPTHSDGFALTQLEAQAHGLPVIASRHCGDVVVDGENGLLLDDISGPALAAAIARYRDNPSLLAAHSAKAPSALARFAPQVVIDKLQAVVQGA